MAVAIFKAIATATFAIANHRIVWPQLCNFAHFDDQEARQGIKPEGTTWDAVKPIAVAPAAAPVRKDAASEADISGLNFTLKDLPLNSYVARVTCFQPNALPVIGLPCNHMQSKAELETN